MTTVWPSSTTSTPLSGPFTTVRRARGKRASSGWSTSVKVSGELGMAGPLYPTARPRSLPENVLILGHAGHVFHEVLLAADVDRPAEQADRLHEVALHHHEVALFAVRS